MTQVLYNDTTCNENYKDNLSETSGESGDIPETLDRPERQDKTETHKVHEVFNVKMKSSLCKNYSEKGVCPYGDKCQFAHGTLELKCNNEQMAYKTRPCHAFLRKGYCLYGCRCNFLHPQQESESKVTTITIREPLYKARKISTSRLLELLAQ